MAIHHIRTWLHITSRLGITSFALCVHTASMCAALQAVMAIGDGGNDLPLLQSVGLGVAMGNAVPQVCAHASDAPVDAHCIPRQLV